VARVSDHGVLDELPILRFLPEGVRAHVIRRFVPASFPFGSVIVAEGSPSDAFYVLVSGKARVVKRGSTGDEIPLNVLRAGDSVGEAELLDGAVRPSTVRASTHVLALRLDADEFRTLVDAHPDIRTYLELQVLNKTNIWLNLNEYQGQTILTFRGVPIRTVDAILNTEARLV